jgi:hypothetical protein
LISFIAVDNSRNTSYPFNRPGGTSGAPVPSWRGRLEPTVIEENDAFGGGKFGSANKKVPFPQDSVPVRKDTFAVGYGGLTRRR